MSTAPPSTNLAENPCLVVTADHNIKIEKAPIEEPGEGQVLLHVRATGICGSDVHFWKHGRIGDLTIDGDCILGHEASGTILKTGPGVTALSIGDRVAIEPGVPCGHCFLCNEGRYNLCHDVAFSGVYPYHGTIQRYKVHPAKYLYKLPDNMTFSTASLLEPLSVALHALRTTPINVGTPVAIFGAGPIGLLTMAVAKASGAYPILVTDVDDTRLRFAKSFEPSCMTYQVSLNATAEENAKAIRKYFKTPLSVTWEEMEKDMPSLVLECTGIESSVLTACYTARRGGTINVVGVSSKPLISIPFMHLSLAEIQLRFINRYHGTWPSGIRAIQGGLLSPEKLEALITHTFKLEEAIQAMELVAGVTKREAGEMVVKVQIIDQEL